MPKISDIILLEHADLPVVITTARLALPEMGTFIARSFGSLNEYIKKEGIIPTDVPFVAYFKWRDMYHRPINICVGYTLSKEYPGTDEIKSSIIPAGKMVTCMFRGGYAEMQECYDAMEKWAEKRGLNLTGDCYELYYNGAEFDEEDYLTKIIMTVI